MGTSVAFEAFGYVTGDDNFLCDALSRNTVVADLGTKGLTDFGPFFLSTSHRILEFCKPYTDTISDEGFFEYWGTLRAFLNDIVVGSPEDYATTLGGSSAATEDPDLPQLIS